MISKYGQQGLPNGGEGAGQAAEEGDVFQKAL